MTTSATPEAREGIALRLARVLGARPGSILRRRGLSAQRPRRHAERAVRKAVVAFLRWARAAGLSWSVAASKLKLGLRTAHAWFLRWSRDRLRCRGVGRPASRSPRAVRAAVLATIQERGPGVGVAVLQGLYPQVTRAELAELLRRYRRAWRRRHRLPQDVLTWHGPGYVWAMDFTEPPGPVDGRHGSILAVRDLGSGDVLWFTEHEHADHEATLVALGTLFHRHGAPLVVKSDNGSHFTASAVGAFLAAHGVLHLPSPPYYAPYNGAIEAGIGSLKSRADHLAARAGRPGEWSAEDLEAARRMANETARPWGAHGPTPQEVWATRQPIHEEQRRAFLAEYRQQEATARTEMSCEQGVALDRRQQDAVNRVAIRRTLVASGILQCQRRVITPPIPPRK